MSQLPANSTPVDQLSPLAEQAIRLRRQKWKDPDVLAQEIYMILSQDQPATTGPVTYNVNDGTTNPPQPPVFPGPLPGLPFPDLFLPDPNLQDIPLQADDPNTDPGNPDDTPTTRRKKTTTQTYHLRTNVPGQITGGSGSFYDVDLYPNGRHATNQDGTPTKKSVSGVEQLEIAQGETIPQGTWTMVFWHVVLQVITRQVLESGGGTQGNRVVSTTTELKIASQDYCMQVPVWLA